MNLSLDSPVIAFIFLNMVLGLTAIFDAKVLISNSESDIDASTTLIAFSMKSLSLDVVVMLEGSIFN